MACVFLLRLPSALVPHELNADESIFLSLAMKFMVDPRPWIAADLTTSGPLNSYFISVFLWMGFKPGFVLVHMLASILISLQVLMAYLTLRRLGSEKAAAAGAFLMVLFYGLVTHPHYLHYASLLLPTLVLMVGFYLFLVWLDEPIGRPTGVQLCLLFSAGLALGTAPWCKLQAAPITAALGLVVLAAIFRARGSSFSFSWRVKELIAFSAGAVLTSCVMLAVLAETGAIRDFWYSYILNSLAYAGPLSLTGIITNLLLLFLFWPLRQPLLFWLLGVGLVVHASQGGDILLFFRKRKWACIGLLAYAGAALFAACRPRYSIGTYAILLVPPMTYLAAAPLRTFPEVAYLRKSLRAPHRLIFVVLVLLFATIDGARYANLVRATRQLSHSQADWNPRIAKAVPQAPATDSNDRMATMKHILARSIAPCSWEVRDSNERIADVVHDIQKKRPVRSLAIWGWAPGVYVLTGMPPATRDSIEFTAISPGPLQKYFRARFVGDLREKPPDLFIDAVARGSLMWRDWTENDGYESDPHLRKFVEDNYILVDELTLVTEAKPIRFFARRSPAPQPQ
jgi:hypothetical protein